MTKIYPYKPGISFNGLWFAEMKFGAKRPKDYLQQTPFIVASIYFLIDLILQLILLSVVIGISLLGFAILLFTLVYLTETHYNLFVSILIILVALFIIFFWLLWEYRRGKRKNLAWKIINTRAIQKLIQWEGNLDKK